METSQPERGYGNKSDQVVSLRGLAPGAGLEGSLQQPASSVDSTAVDPVQAPLASEAEPTSNTRHPPTVTVDGSTAQSVVSPEGGTSQEVEVLLFSRDDQQMLTYISTVPSEVTGPELQGRGLVGSTGSPCPNTQPNVRTFGYSS